VRRLGPDSLATRDLAILRDLDRVRLLSGQQLERLHFAGLANTNVRGSARRRTLGRLIGLKLVTTLPRRIGGERAGSSGLIYSLDARAHRERALWAVSTDSAAERPVRRPWSIGWLFVKHNLDVTELYVQLREAEARQRLTVLAFDGEPAAWFTISAGSTLKPDAYAVIESDGWERHWWIEVDRATESLPTLRRKLGRYTDLLQSGQPGPDGVLPNVLVTVPDEHRAQQLRRVVDALPRAASFITVTLHDSAREVLAGQEARPPPGP
jgi:hypothetical protein